MHQLAIALKRKGYTISGTDDEIFEPSRTNLENEGLLPTSLGWNTGLITPDLEAVILGMHAKSDNPEIEKAKSFGVTDIEIHDTVLIASMFCMFNRYVDGLNTWAPQEKDFYISRAKQIADTGYTIQEQHSGK